MKKRRLSVLMVASECRGIAKVGGLADVVRDLSQNLHRQGHQVAVVMPGYSSIKVPSEIVLDFLVRFGGATHPARLRKTQLGDLAVYLVEATPFTGEDGGVYIDSGARGKGPFEDDALRFAFFCAAVWSLLKTHHGFAEFGVLHCHDWHTAFLPLFLRLEGTLPGVRSVFTIHNLEYQGTRPFDGNYAPGASFRQWFPELRDELDQSGVIELCRDPGVPWCFNPMRTGIRLADAVNTVSPTYAQEITRADNPEANFLGGRGLEPDLNVRQSEGNLLGILNGMDYDEYDPSVLVPPFFADTPDLLAVKQAYRGKLAQQLRSLATLGDRASHHLPVFLDSLGSLPLVICVTRAVAQKFSLVLDPLTSGRLVLDALLESPVHLVVLGTGELASRLEALNDHPSALFLNLFDAGLATTLFCAGDLLLMPSDFEPCGLSQLLAMRFGCLPLVHDRGGLHDTVTPGQTGFVFGGTTRHEAISSLFEQFDRALRVLADPQSHELMIRKALAARFDWSGSTLEYEQLYRRLAARA